MTDDNAPTPTPTPTQPVVGQDADQGGVPRWLGWALLGFTALVIVAQIWVSAKRALTPLETGLFNGLTVVIGLVGSVLVSGYYWRKQSSRDVENARTNYQQLARPAWRRVVSIETSLARIQGSIAEHAARLAEDPEGKLLQPQAQAQWVDGLRRQVEHVGDHITAAIEDWRELLPEDFAALVEEQKRVTAALAELADRRKRMQELEDELRQKDAQVNAMAADQGQAEETSAQEVEAAKAEAEKLRADLEAEQDRYRKLADKINRGSSTTVTASGLMDNNYRVSLNPRVRAFDGTWQNLVGQTINPIVARSAAVILDSVGDRAAAEAQVRASADRRDDQEVEHRGLDPDTGEAR